MSLGMNIFSNGLWNNYCAKFHAPTTKCSDHLKKRSVTIHSLNEWLLNYIHSENNDNVKTHFQHFSLCYLSINTLQVVINVLCNFQNNSGFTGSGFSPTNFMIVLHIVVPIFICWNKMNHLTFSVAVKFIWTFYACKLWIGGTVCVLNLHEDCVDILRL